MTSLMGLPRRTHLWRCLLPLLHRDLIPIVQSYAAIIEGYFLLNFAAFEQKFHRPEDLHLSGSELYVIDLGRVLVFERKTGKFLRETCLAPRMSYLRLAAVGDNLLVNDAMREEIKILDRATLQHRVPWEELTTKDFFGTKTEKFSCLSAICSDEKHIYIVCQSKIHIFTHEREHIRSFTIRKDPEGADINANVNSSMIVSLSHLYLSLPGSNEILVISLETNRVVQDFAERDLERPSGIAVHGNELLVCDVHHHRIVAFDLNTTKMVRTFGQLGTKPGEFNSPCNIVCTSGGQNSLQGVRSEDQAFVSDYFNSRVQVFE